MSNLLVQNLKMIFPPQEYGKILRALRNDPIIWNALQNPELAGQMVNLAGADQLKWSPAYLALVVLGIQDKFHSLRTKPVSIDEKIKYQAAAELEKLTNFPGLDPGKTSIENVGMITIALRERWIILKHSDTSIFSEQPNVTIWKTVAACLLGLLPNPDDLLKALLTSNHSRLRTIAIHAVSTNPDPDLILANSLLPIIKTRPTVERIEILRQCSQVNKPLAEYLAAELIAQLANSPKAAENPFEVIQDFAEMSELFRITGQYEQAIPTLEKLWQATTSLQTDLTAQLAQTAAKANHQTAAIQAIEKISQIEDHLEPDARANVTIAQIHTGQLDPKSLDSAPAPGTISPPNPAILAAKAQVAHKNEQQIEAQNLATQAYEITSQFLQGNEELSGKISTAITPDFLQSLIELLIDLDLVIEASMLCDHALTKLPNNDEIVSLNSKAAMLAGDLNLALEHATIAVALAPDNTTYRYKLIDLLIRQSNWLEALKETEAHLARIAQPSAKDHQLMAVCYLNTKQLEKAVHSVKKGLEIEPDKADLHALLASIFKQDHKWPEAIKHLNKAVLLDPQAETYWAELAAAYQEQANIEKAEEILRSAFEVLPNNPSLHLHLGQIHEENQKPEDALAEFQQARQLVTAETAHITRRKIYHNLGKALFLQGYHQEALNTLEEGHQAFPVDAEIAHLYGKTLLDNGQVPEALSALQVASQGMPDSAAVLLDYGKALLFLGGKTEEARRKIEGAIELEPENLVGMALLADATAQAGEHSQALKIYQQALMSDLAKDPGWQVSLSTNLAKSAFALDQPEVAITFLQETLQIVPDSLAAKQTLCQAYIQTKLTRDALRIINEILQTYSQNLEVLMWAADQAILINDLELAAEILHQAHQISPHKADILVRLGYIQLENDEEEMARETFGQLFSAENVDVKNLRLAAQALIGLGDISSSIPYLEKALELSDHKSSDLLNELTKLHLRSGNFQEALETVKKQIKIQPMLPSLHVTQADIYYKLSQQKAALNSMLRALELSPDSAELHAKTAYLLRKNQDLPSCLYHIKQALEIDDQDPRIRLQAAQVFRACLLDDQARAISESFAEQEKPSLASLLLAAELILEQGNKENYEKAAGILAQAEELAASHPRLLAAQARLSHLLGDFSQAEEQFEQALLNLAEFEQTALNPITLSAIYLSVARTAMVMHRWDVALFFAREAQQFTPHEPEPHFLQVVAYTQRAEISHRDKSILKRCQFPQGTATHRVSQEAFQTAVKTTEAHSPDPDAELVISRWHARGEMALLNADPAGYIETLRHTPQDFAALLAGFRRAGLFPDIDLTQHHQDPDVTFERALLNRPLDIQHALSLAESLVQLEPNNCDFAALYAILAQEAGQTQVALNSIQIALSHCPKEPHWHAMAGELHLARGKYEEAISHLERALELNPKNPGFLFTLGQAYTAVNSAGNAVRVLEEATSIEPLEAEYWVFLAKAYHKFGNAAYAVEAINQALKLAPTNLEHLLTAAELASLSKDPEYAASMINKAILVPTQNIKQIIQISELLITFDRLDDAVKYIESKIELAVDQIALQVQRAKIIGLIQGGRQMLEILIKLAKENPQNPLIFAHLADAYIETDNPEEAIRAAQFALKYADDALDTAHRTKLHYQLGVLLRQAGQLDQALHQLTQSLQLSPNFLAARLEIGETLYQRKEFLQALEHYQKAIEIAPQDARAYKKAGVLLKESKDYLAAEAMFRQAYSLDPNDIFTQRQLATVIALALIHQPNASRFSHGKSKNR